MHLSIGEKSPMLSSSKILCIKGYFCTNLINRSKSFLFLIFVHFIFSTNNNKFIKLSGFILCMVWTIDHVIFILFLILNIIFGLKSSKGIKNIREYARFGKAFNKEEFSY